MEMQTKGDDTISTDRFRDHGELKFLYNHQKRAACLRYVLAILVFSCLVGTLSVCVITQLKTSAVEDRLGLIIARLNDLDTSSRGHRDHVKLSAQTGDPYLPNNNRVNFTSTSVSDISNVSQAVADIKASIDNSRISLSKVLDSLNVLNQRVSKLEQSSTSCSASSVVDEINNMLETHKESTRQNRNNFMEEIQNIVLNSSADTVTLLKSSLEGYQQEFQQHLDGNYQKFASDVNVVKVSED